MKLGIHTETTNRRFQKALRRINGKVDELKHRMANIDIPGRHGNLMLTFFDEDPSMIRVTTRGKNDDIYEVDVGFDSSGSYPPEDDVLVIQLLEEKLEQVIDGDAGFKDKKAELLKIISEWTTESIGA